MGKVMKRCRSKLSRMIFRLDHIVLNRYGDIGDW